MCCVIPPASVSTTADSRIASSSEVLPWSTWPMIVTTGGRGDRSSSASSKTSGSSSSSAAYLIVIARPSSAPISSTSSSESDCVIWTIWPRPIMILMIWAAGTLSPCERSRTETPDGTVAGPVGGATSCRSRFGGASPRLRAWRGFGRFEPPSITTRRLRPAAPCRGRIGRFGLLGPSAISVQCRGESLCVDVNVPSQDAVEGAPVYGALETGQPPARVRAPARLRPSPDELPAANRKAGELRLRRLPTAARAGALWGAFPLRRRQSRRLRSKQLRRAYAARQVSRPPGGLRRAARRLPRPPAARAPPPPRPRPPARALLPPRGAPV